MQKSKQEMKNLKNGMINFKEENSLGEKILRLALKAKFCVLHGDLVLRFRIKYFVCGNHFALTFFVD